MADELSDAEVMTAPSKELSDTEVSAPPSRSGGLLRAIPELTQTVPQLIGVLGTPEGRGKLPEALNQAVVQPLLNFFKAPGTAYKQGLTPEQETEFGFAGATFELGRARPFLSPTPRITVPLDPANVQEFHDAAVAPAMQRIDSFARTGDPNGVRLEPPLPETKPSPIIPIADSPFAGVPRSIMAKTGDPVLDSILFHPTIRAVIDNPIVDRSHTIPYEAGGSLPENRATTYIEKSVPQQFTVRRLSDPTKTITFDTAEPTILHENPEEFTMELLQKYGMKADAAYRVSHFKVAQVIEDFWYRANDIDPVAAQAEWKKIQPGIQHEIANDIPADLYAKEYPGGDVTKARHEEVFEAEPTPEEVAQAWEILRNAPELKPKSPIPMLQQARDLGVIGGDRPSLNKLPPKDAGRETLPPDPPQPGEPGGPREQPTEWRKRWEATLDKMGTADDVRKVLGSILDANDEFMPARQGDMTSAQTEQLGLVSGVNPTKINIAKTSDKIKTDLEMRNLTEAFRSINDKIQTAARDLREKKGIDDEAEAGELTRLELQRDLLMESTVATKGLVAFRAEFGRAGNLLQDFYKAQREAAGLKDYLRDKEGRDITDVRDRAKMIAETPPEALPTVLQNMPRTMKPPHWLFYVYQNVLISGVITHTLYAPVNFATTIFERSLSPLLASLIDRVRGENTSVTGPLYANLALVKSIPDAFATAKVAFKTGTRAPSAAELELAARDIASPEGLKVPYTGTQVNWGMWKSLFNISDKNLAAAAKIIGMPGRSANFQHTFFRIMNEEASLATRAYQHAHDEGVTGDEFWDRYNYHRANMSDEDLKGAITDGYSGTFMEKLGDRTGSLARFLSKTPVLQYFFPFQHIPWNIERMTVKYSPATLANIFLDTKTGQALRGDFGIPAQSLALAKMVNGMAIMGYFIHKGMQGQATPDYPRDAKGQAEHRVMNTPPNSVQIGDEWVDMNRLAMPGNLAKMGANLGYIIKHYDGQDDQAMQKALWSTAWAAANVVADETSFNSVKNFIDVWEGREPPVRFFGQIAANFVPALIAQPASAMDPYVRKADSLISELMYRVPWLRETLPPKVDPIYGEPLPNPHYHTLMKEVPIQRDPAKLEMERLGYFPAAPQKKIGGITLNDEQYLRYEVTAGQYAKRLLNGLVNSPQYRQMNPAQQRAELKEKLSFARAQARTAMAGFYPAELSPQGIARRNGQITGERPLPIPALPPLPAIPAARRSEIPREEENMFSPSGILGIRG